MAAEEVRLPTVNRDWLIDMEAAAAVLGLTARAIQYHLAHECDFPRPVKPVEAAEIVTMHPGLRPSFAELFRRAGSRGVPMNLFLQSRIISWGAMREAGKRR